MSAAVVLPSSYRLTYRDWYEFSTPDCRCELLDGEIYLTPLPSILHQRISRRLQHALVVYLARTSIGELLDAPVGVRLSDEDVVEPDLLIVLSEHADRIGEQVVDGAPDIAA